MSSHNSGSPFAPHTPEETAAMLAAVGAASEEDLFDIPDGLRFDGAFGIESRSEQATRAHVDATLGRNADLTEFLGRGHYDHYVPSLVDHLSQRSEFLTSYTQYQPEVAQGFLQALFEYQSMLVELTGLDVANCSMYDAATALGEAATLAARLRRISGETVLVPDLLHEGRRGVLENYVEGAGLAVESYPTDDANADVEALADRVEEDVAMVYAENPTVRGTIEERLPEIGDLAHENDALFVLGTDVLALALLREPASVGADVVVGEAASLGLGASYGMGLGLFACREAFLRQVPGRLVGVSEDATGRRAYTLTLQTREQHIRRERATSNICTNQAWVALRAAMHAATLGPQGLVDLANDCVTATADLAERVDAIVGMRAPVHDRHHFREFVAHTDQPAAAVASDLEREGFAVHVVGEHEIQLCTTETNAARRDALVEALEVVA
ncbi:aminomethyl-transferring glycine dehydrogenase subunit GcvPA [Halomarina pelagica]|uniref:aminomethyl-transferring glycine dehydrogenase subunit GcvPA n=1 Tax=Halomarina pelagica TaxID=2961599 RepID=UPI0020C41A05|nr:aminomethyl-transferring glycine dehydrogenase subunit GcvPA [Halomarina sp. BND7]